MSEIPSAASSAPETPRASSPHPLEAHLQQLETYETERPPFYNKSTLAPDLVFSAESLRQDAKILAKVLVSFMAYAVKNHGTTGSCNICVWGRLEMWPDRPVEANSMASTILNDRNLVYCKALKYARKDFQDRGLWVKRFLVREDKKRHVSVADWTVDWNPPADLQTGRVAPSPNDLIRLHQESHNARYRAVNPRSPQRASTAPVTPTATLPGLNLNRVIGRLGNGERRGQPAKRSRKSHETNEFGYYGNNCVMM